MQQISLANGDEPRFLRRLLAAAQVLRSHVAGIEPVVAANVTPGLDREFKAIAAVLMQALNRKSGFLRGL